MQSMRLADMPVTLDLGDPSCLIVYLDPQSFCVELE